MTKKYFARDFILKQYTLPTDQPVCMSIQEILMAIQRDAHLQQLNEYTINGWPESRNEIPQEV